MNKKTFNLNFHSKYYFTNELIQYLEISQKPYTILEISNTIRMKIFNMCKTKEVTWEEIDLFNLNSKQMFLIFESPCKHRRII
jgi:hypothetical protein